ncbi:MAG: M15 family metallopeptidase, partial [Methylacidiphilales bacterium]|nr:M15 family metallopeptidase [Candidatus Methylacidiphilales bacterium]
DFMSGFIGGAIGSAAGAFVNSIKLGGTFGLFTRTAITAAAGGTAAMLGGGNFANGALSAAFTYLFNEAILTIKDMMDNFDHILKLDTRLAEIADDHIELANKELNPLGYKVKISSSYRSIKEQNEIYAKGRTKPGKIVTYAKGGMSAHNYGLAYDIVIIDSKGNLIWSGPLMERVGIIGESLGLVWGGRFKSIKDCPHFQHFLVPSGKDMYERYKKGLDVLYGF